MTRIFGSAVLMGHGVVGRSHAGASAVPPSAT
jgi:hypothetical protein